MSELNLESEDLYELLGASIDSSTADIKKAYRKKALECHPDKNPDNPNAAIEFHKLSRILEILIDASARAAYDKVLKARQEAKIRHQQLDSKRRKLKEELEAKERQAASFGKNKSAEQQLREEVERLRKEGCKQVEEEMAFVLRQVKEEQQNQASEDTGKYRVKIKWKAAKKDPENGGYSEELLQKFLSKYGDITVLIMSPKKTGSALVEYKTLRAAEMAVDLEKGLSVNPLQMEWVNGPPQGKKYQSSMIKESDFESVVLTKMRQAEERKRLIEQMMRDDADET